MALRHVAEKPLVCYVTDYFPTSSSGSRIWMEDSRHSPAGPALTLWPWPCATRAWSAETAASARWTACPSSTWTAACRLSEVHTKATTQSRRSKVKRTRRRNRGGRRKGGMSTMIAWWKETLTLRWETRSYYALLSCGCLAAIMLTCALNWACQRQQLALNHWF